MKESSLYQTLLKEAEPRGKREGTLEIQKNIALKMLHHGVSYNDIIQFPELFADDLQKLVRTMAENN